MSPRGLSAAGRSRGEQAEWCLGGPGRGAGVSPGSPGPALSRGRPPAVAAERAGGPAGCTDSRRILLSRG